MKKLINKEDMLLLFLNSEEIKMYQKDLNLLDKLIYRIKFDFNNSFKNTSIKNTTIKCILEIFESVFL